MNLLRLKWQIVKSPNWNVNAYPRYARIVNLLIVKSPNWNVNDIEIGESDYKQNSKITKLECKLR